VAACHLVYTSTYERCGDAHGALARFYERHIHAAVRGHAFLVARDRETGLVMVLDSKRKIIARTDDIVASMPSTQATARRIAREA
jgi:hypothetical protein